MEPEVHRLDREQRLADHAAVAERRRAEVDAALVVAVEKRRAFLEWFVNHMRIEAKSEGERERLWADMRIASQRSVTPEHEPVVLPAQSEASGWWEEAELDLALPWAAHG